MRSTCQSARLKAVLSHDQSDMTIDASFADFTCHVEMSARKVGD